MAAIKTKLTFNPFTGNFDYIRADDGTGNVVLENVPTDPSVVEGNWVRMSGGFAVNALADDATNGNVIGVCEEKISANVGNIRVLGLTGPIYFGLTENLEYYLSDTVPGGMQTNPPTTPGAVVIKVGQSFSETELLVLKGIRKVRS